MVDVSEVPCTIPPDATEELSVKVGGVTVNVIEVDGAKNPLVPTIVMLYVPGTVVALAENCKVHVPLALIGFGLNVAVTPLGRPEAVKVMLPIKFLTEIEES